MKILPVKEGNKTVLRIMPESTVEDFWLKDLLGDGPKDTWDRQHKNWNLAVRTTSGFAGLEDTSMYDLMPISPEIKGKAIIRRRTQPTAKAEEKDVTVDVKEAVRPSMPRPITPPQNEAQDTF